MTAIRAGLLNLLKMTSLYVLLHVLLGFTHMLAISTSELSPAHCHDLQVHHVHDSLVLNISWEDSYQNMTMTIGIKIYFEFLCFLET